MNLSEIPRGYSWQEAKALLPPHHLTEIPTIDTTNLECCCGWKASSLDRSELNQLFFDHHSEPTYELILQSLGLPLDTPRVKSGHLTPKEAKKRMVNRYGMTCWWCKKPIEEGELSAEHLLPREFGGNNWIENLSPVHKSCNR